MWPGLSFVDARTLLRGNRVSDESAEWLVPSGEIRTKAILVRAGKCEKTSERAAAPLSENPKPAIGKLLSDIAKAHYVTYVQTGPLQTGIGKFILLREREVKQLILSNEGRGLCREPDSEHGSARAAVRAHTEE